MRGNTKGNTKQLVKILLLPMFKNNKINSIVLLIVSVFGISLFIALNSAVTSCIDSKEKYFEKYKLPEGVVVLETFLPKEAVAKLTPSAGIQSYSTRFVVDIPIKIEGQLLSTRLFSYQETDEVAKLFFERDIRENGDEGIYFSKEFERFNREVFRPGNPVVLCLPTGEKTVNMLGIATTPEHSITYRNAYVWRDDVDFGNAYMEEKEMFSLFEPMEGYNQIIVTFEEGCDQKAALDTFAKQLEPYGISSTQIYKGSQLESNIQAAQDSLAVCSGMIPAVFFVVMIIFYILSISQIVEKLRKEIGILRALGYAQWSIVFFFVLYAVAIVLVALLLSIGVGYLLAIAVGDIFKNGYNIVEFQLNFRGSMILIGFGGAFLAAVGSSFLAAKKATKIEPSEAMRKYVSKEIGVPLLFRTVFKGLNSKMKICLTPIFRNKRRFCFGVFCIAASGLLMVFSLYFFASSRYVVTFLFEKRLLYDSQIFLDGVGTEETKEQLREAEDVERFETIPYGEANLLTGGKEQVIMIYGIPKEATLTRIYDSKKKPIVPKPNHIILEEELAKELQVEEGDQVEVNGISLTVQAIATEYANFIQYTDEETAHDIFGNKVAESILVSLKPSANGVFSGVEQLDRFSYCVDTAKQRISWITAINGICSVMYIATLFAFIMGGSILTNLSVSGFTERKREYQILRGLGFSVRSVSFMMLMEAFLQYILALVLTIPLGYLGGREILRIASTSAHVFPITGAKTAPIILAIVLFIMVLCGNILSILRLKKMKLV